MFNLPNHIKPEIKAAIAEISASSIHHWTKLGNLLMQVENSGVWKEDSKNFTEWMNTHCSDFGLKPTVLWAHFRMARYYTDKMYNDLLRWDIAAPETVLDLPKIVNLEVLEMYSKIAGIAPDSICQALAARVLAGTVKRSELRSLWQAYRTEIGQEPNRPGRYSTEKMSSVKDKAEKSRIAQLMTALSNNREWLKNSDESTSLSYKVVNAVTIKQQALTVGFDLLLLVTMDAGITELHGIEFIDSKSPNCNDLVILKSFVDVLWLAVPDDFDIKKAHDELSGYGLLQINDGNIVAKYPQHVNRGKNVLTTARVLLQRL